MRDKLEEFRKVLAESDPDTLKSLKPGLSRQEVEERFSRLPFKITTDAVELYTWADGTFENPVEILPGGYFMGIDEAITEFEQVNGIRDMLENIFPQKYRDCFRFLGDFSDGGYAFGRIDSPSKGQIIELCIHDYWKLAFESLEKLIDTAIECRRRGIFKTGDIPDISAYYKLAHELNPGMENWSAASL